ncbi:MAG TPA: amino acid permease [Thermoanaerobaculia bacterium]|nr:amino acid permease [Thermoanaerobaculia bacterium]
MEPNRAPASEESRLVRGLGTWDAALLTIGSVVGTGIFLTTSDIARVLPDSGLILWVWVAGGLLTLAGALTYAELGVMFPRAGGLYHYLREAYGPLWGFLYGWIAFLVIMSGGIATIAVGFGKYLASFVPSLAETAFAVRIPGLPAWEISGIQLAAVGSIVLLTGVNHLGLEEGAWVQNALTVVKVGSILVFGVLAFLVPAPATSEAATAPASPVPMGGALLVAFGVAMVATLWTYDGWYGLTCSAGEVRDPARSLPRGLILGTVAVIGLYLLLNLAYVRALPVAAMAAEPRIAEAAAGRLFGAAGARLVTVAVLVSAFGCISSTILYSSRIYLPMAADGLFFRSLAAVHPRFRTPVRSLWAQSAWAAVLALSGTYEQLYTYVVFASVVFHAAIAAAVFVFRRCRPDLPRPYRTWGYPVVPALFILACLLLIGNTLVDSPRESLAGLGLLALGLPAYALFRRQGSHPH